jgi:hypothetical protein
MLRTRGFRRYENGVLERCRRHSWIGPIFVVGTVLESRECGGGRADTGGFVHLLSPRLWLFDAFQGLGVWQASGIAI